MEYLIVILIITVCSLLHDGNYTVTWAKKIIGERYGKYFGKGFVVALQTIVTCWVLHGYGLAGYAAALASVGIFWGVFRRGWQAQAELTSIRLKTREAILGILKAYPKAFEYLPRLITKWVVKMPYPQYHRRIQSGLIALLCTGPVSALPIYLLTFLNLPY